MFGIALGAVVTALITVFIRNILFKKGKLHIEVMS